MITEIYCSICKGYNTVDIPEHVNGLHIIICGKCKHEHYRCINDGVITDKRYECEVLEKFKINSFRYEGVWREKPWERPKESLFLNQLWARGEVYGHAN